MWFSHRRQGTRGNGLPARSGICVIMHVRLQFHLTVSSEQGEKRTRRRWVTREEEKWVPWMEKGCASLGTGGGAATLYQSSSASTPLPVERYERHGSVVVGGNARSDLGQTNEPWNWYIPTITGGGAVEGSYFF
jgi:hypothetical protein